MKNPSTRNLEKVMTFSEVLSVATDIARSGGGMFLRAVLMYGGVFQLIRAILELDFTYRQVYEHSISYNTTFITTWQGIVSTLLLAAGLTVVMIIAFRTAAQYANGGSAAQKPGDLLQFSKSRMGSLSVIVLVQTALMAISVVIILFLMGAISSAFVKFLLFVGGFFWMFYLSTSFSMGPYVAINEKLPALKSIDRSFELVAGNRWFVFGLMILVGAMVALVNMGIGMLFGLLFFFIFMTGAPDFESTFYLVIAIQLFSSVVYVVGTGLLMLVLAVQYFNLRERKDAVAIERKIEALGVSE